MSHELRTPLNAIIGFSEIMESGMFGPLGADKYREYCRDIHQSGQYLLDVINDILDMSKIEAGRIRLDLERGRTRAASSTTPCAWCRAAPTTSGSRSVAESVPASASPAIRRLLKQIVLNLLSNAVKFTPEGGRITIRARACGRRVSIAIVDTGIGIPKDALARLGRPFEQVESQLTKSHQGSGLGLAIAKSLTELHGGTHAHPLDARKGHDGAAAAADRRPGGPARRDRGGGGLIASRPAPPRLSLNRHLAQNALEACAHLGLRLANRRIERGEVRHVGGTRQQPQQFRRRGLGIERTRQAQAQDLREIVIEPHRRAQHLGILRC